MIAQMKWTREPREYRIENDLVVITTEPHTDLWQRTYYHFRNDTRPTTKATSRKLSKMKIWEAYFYLRHLVLNNEKGKRKDKKVVKFISEVRVSDAL